MDYGTARRTIEQHFASEWANKTPINWQSNDFGAHLSLPHVAFRIVDKGSDARTISGVYRSTGSVIVSIFTPLGAGTRAADDLAMAARAIFAGKRVGGIQFGSAVIRDAGIDAAGAWVNGVTTPFAYDQT